MSCSLCALSNCSCQPLCQGLLRSERGRSRCTKLSNAPCLARRSGLPLRCQAGVPGLHACETFYWKIVLDPVSLASNSSLPYLLWLQRRRKRYAATMLRSIGMHCVFDNALRSRESYQIGDVR